MVQEGALNIAGVNCNEVLKMQPFIWICFIKITLRMSKNYCFNLKNKPLSAKAWQQYGFSKFIWSM